MAGDTGSHIRGVLDGDINASDVTASDRGQQVENEIDMQLAQQRIQAEMATQAPSLMQWAVQPGQVATAAPGGGGGYQFDAEAIAARIHDWEQLLEDIRADESELMNAQYNLIPPSADKPAA